MVINLYLCVHLLFVLLVSNQSIYLFSILQSIHASIRAKKYWHLSITVFHNQRYILYSVKTQVFQDRPTQVFKTLKKKLILKFCGRIKSNFHSKEGISLSFFMGVVVGSCFNQLFCVNMWVFFINFLLERGVGLKNSK